MKTDGRKSIKASIFAWIAAAFFLALAYALFPGLFSAWSAVRVIVFLSACALLMILSLFLVYHAVPREVRHADNEA